MSLRPRTPSSEKEPLRLIKSLSFNADTGMILLWGRGLLIAGYFQKHTRQPKARGTRQAGMDGARGKTIRTMRAKGTVSSAQT